MCGSCAVILQHRRHSYLYHRRRIINLDEVFTCTCVCSSVGFHCTNISNDVLVWILQQWVARVEQKKSPRPAHILKKPFQGHMSYDTVLLCLELSSGFEVCTYLFFSQRPRKSDHNWRWFLLPSQLPDFCFFPFFFATRTAS